MRFATFTCGPKLPYAVHAIFFKLTFFRWRAMGLDAPKENQNQMFTVDFFFFFGGGKGVGRKMGGK